MNDIDIVKSIQSWDKDSYVVLYDRYIKKIYDFVYYKVWNQSDAEDISSDVFLKAYDKIWTFDIKRQSSFSSWLYTIANNLVIDFYRTKKEVVDTDLISERPNYTDMLWDIQNRDKIQQVLEYLDTLDPEHKEIVIMRVWNDMSYNEIADITWKSVDNCKQIFSRTMKKVAANVSVEALLLFIFLMK